jgi:uncharacterized protein (DUF1330 family)
LNRLTDVISIRDSARRFAAAEAFWPTQEDVMNHRIALGLAMLAGAAFGAAAVNGLNAQNKAPGAYAVVDISEITDQKLFDQIGPKAGPSNDAFGGKYIIRTNNMTSIDGTPPKRLVVIAFDSVEKAKAWNSSSAQKEINDLRMKSMKSRLFIADGTIN